MSWTDREVPGRCPACSRAWYRDRHSWWWMAHIGERTKIYCRNCYAVTGEIDFRSRKYEPLPEQQDA